MSFEYLKAYQAAQRLRAEIDRLKQYLQPGFEYQFKHVDECADSILNNLAEGSGSIYEGTRKKYYDTAGNSAREARSGLSSIERRGGFKGASAFRAIGFAIISAKLIKGLIESTVAHPPRAT